MHVCDTEQLCGGKHLRRFVVVTADLFHTFRQPVLLVSGFSLHHRHWDPVNQKHNIGAISVYYPFLRPFIGYMKQVIVRVLKINQRNIPITILQPGRKPVSLHATERVRLGFLQALG